MRRKPTQRVLLHRLLYIRCDTYRASAARSAAEPRLKLTSSARELERVDLAFYPDKYTIDSSELSGLEDEIVNGDTIKKKSSPAAETPRIRIHHTRLFGANNAVAGRFLKVKFSSSSPENSWIQIWSCL